MSETIELPTEPVGPEQKNPSTMLIYGPPKIGKTTIMSGLENNLIIDIEKGSKFVTAMKKKVSDLSELQALGSAIVNKGKPYKYITIDTVTKLEEWCHDRALEKYKNSTQGSSFNGNTLAELDYGLGYAKWREEFKLWMNKLSGLADHVIFLGHVKDKMLSKDGEEVHMKDINLTGQIKAIATSDVDAVGYMYLDKENQKNRKLTFLTQDDITCGNRIPHLEGKEFIISEKQEDNSVVTHWDKIYID